MSQLTNKQRRWIVKQVVKKGRTMGEVARELGRDKMTIYKVVRRAKETGDCSRQKRSGKLSREDKHSIKTLIKKDASMPSHEIIENLELDVSVSTLCKYLRKKGYRDSGAKCPRRTLYRVDDEEEEEREWKDTRKLSKESQAAIAALLEEDNTLSAREICEWLNLDVSVNTLCKFLRGAGYVCDGKSLPKRTKV
jgi:transposase